MLCSGSQTMQRLHPDTVSFVIIIVHEACHLFDHYDHTMIEDQDQWWTVTSQTLNTVLSIPTAPGRKLAFKTNIYKGKHSPTGGMIRFCSALDLLDLGPLLTKRLLLLLFHLCARIISALYALTSMTSIPYESKNLRCLPLTVSVYVSVFGSMLNSACRALYVSSISCCLT